MNYKLHQLSHVMKSGCSTQSTYQVDCKIDEIKPSKTQLQSLKESNKQLANKHRQDDSKIIKLPCWSSRK